MSEVCIDCGKDKKLYCKVRCRGCYAKHRASQRPTITCADCGQARVHQAHGMCATCCVKAFRASNPGSDAAHVRKSNLKRKYGISLEQYDAMLAAQDHGCAICAGQSAGGRRLAVDHCHTTGKVRSLLCQDCNLALGYIKDDPEHAERLAAYLRRHQ